MNRRRNQTMTESRLWILGAPDPEMKMIEALLRECGEQVVHATIDGVRVHAGNAYRCPIPEVPTGSTVYAVECIDVLPEGWTRIDHHWPGDPGYGRPPGEFLAASSIGQVITVLGQVTTYPAAWRRVAVPRHPHWCGAIERYHGVWVVRTGGGDGDPGQGRDDTATAIVILPEYVLCAAADHCLAAAYRGECPGVDPDELMQWQAETWATFHGDPERGFAGGYLGGAK